MERLFEEHSMETGAEHGNLRSTGARGLGGTVLGSLTIPGDPEQVAVARGFVTRTLGRHRIGTDADAAALLTSEIVTNAIQHTRSGGDGGTVTIVMIWVPHAVLVEVIDEGSPATPVVKGDLYAAEGHGLFLVQHLAAQWGYLRDAAGTTVWFVLAATEEQCRGGEQADPRAGRRPGRPGPYPPGSGPYQARPGQPWPTAVRSATA
jgi:anti-sigma regulatory factor (Ser/Thr protein kinase)